MIAVCMPSRGLIHSRTIEHVLNNTDGLSVRFYFSHDLPIPDCFNDVLVGALKDNPKYIWIVEEDMGFPDDTLLELMRSMSEYDVALIDYPIKDGLMSAHYRGDSSLDYAGVGCVLAKPQTIIDTMPFSSSYIYAVNSDEPRKLHENRQVYGKQDVHFYKQLYAKHYKVGVLSIKGWQYRVSEMGDTKTNKGFHTIRRLKDA